MVSIIWYLSIVVIGLAASVSSSLSSGVGAVGQGRSLFKPTCAFACLDVFWALKLPCSESVPNLNTTFSINSPSCHQSNTEYLESLAWCLHHYCPDEGSTKTQIQDFWSRIAGDGLKVKSWESYLGHAPQTALPSGSVSLKTYSSASPAMYNTSHHTVLSYADQEKYHALWSTVLIAVCTGIGVLLGARSWLDKISHYALPTPSFVKRYLLHPAFIGKHNLQMLPGNFGYVPQRSQTLLIIIFIAVNVALNFVNTPTFNNDTWFISSSTLFTSNLANRLSVLSIANLALAIMLSGRNSLVLCLTGCSRTTIIAFHRWAGRVAVVKGVAHGAIYLSTSDKYGMQVFTPAGALHYIGCIGSYWEFGIASLALFGAILFLSLAPIRVRWYEAFLISHVILGIAVLVSIWYHLINRFHGQYGYEVWLYIAFAFWAFDRVVRVIRIAVFNYGWLMGRDPPAKVELLSDGQLMRVTVFTSTKRLSKPGQYCYVYFPTLSRYIESHPFSIISWDTSDTTIGATFDTKVDSLPLVGPQDSELGMALTNLHPSGSSTAAGITPKPRSFDSYADRPRMTFVIRPCSGMTKRLHQRLIQSQTQSISLPALVEGPYNSSSSSNKIMACDTVLAFAGGVGITGILGHLNKHVAESRISPASRKETKRQRFALIWMVSTLAEVESIRPFLPSEEILSAAGAELRVVCKEKEDVRVDFSAEIVAEKVGLSGKGSLGVLVCGPARMADEIRSEVVKAHGTPGGRLEFSVEAFGW